VRTRAQPRNEKFSAKTPYLWGLEGAGVLPDVGMKRANVSLAP
jgi:Zn-dependent alcohol dehydrogenase